MSAVLDQVQTCGTCGCASAPKVGGMVNCSHRSVAYLHPVQKLCVFEPSRWKQETPEIVARRDAQEGIDRAADAQERRCGGWTDRAYAFVEEFCSRNKGKRLVGRDIVKASLGSDLPQPENDKAWGKPIQRAARRGLLVKVDHVPDPNRHGNPVPLWEIA